MTLSVVVKDDIAVIANYIIDELHSYGVTDTYATSVHVENAVLGSDEAWKVTTNDGTIVAFGAAEKVSPSTLHVVSYFIAKEYRQTKAAYLISKKMLELMEDYAIVVYIPLTAAQQLPTKFCKDSKIDKVALKAFIERFSKRWEVVQKQ